MAYATLQKTLLLNDESLYHRDSDVYNGKIFTAGPRSAVDRAPDS